MSFRLRQKTGVADTACVAMLCMATTMLLGFSSPQQSPQAGNDASTTSSDALQQNSALENPSLEMKPVVPSPAASSSVEATLRTIPAAESLAVLPQQQKVAVRPITLSSDTRLQPALGGVNSRVWLQTSTYHPNQPSSAVGQFHGVGFPDVRTYPRARRSPFAPPEPWAPLVAWRTLQGEQAVTEPIAKVRCMGLTPQAVARRADRYRELIYDYAEQYEISAQLVKAVITEESCFNNKALSPVGAQGLMQLMPETASWLKVKDPHDPAENLRGGVRYLASLQKQFDSLELALAAYNAGPGNVRRYNGVPPFAETRAYVVKVQANYRRYKAAHRLLNPVIDPSVEQADLITEVSIEQARIETHTP